MRSLHYSDIDTLAVYFSDGRVDDFADLDENTLIEFNADGLPVALTIENAKARDVIIDPAVEVITAATVAAEQSSVAAS